MVLVNGGVDDHDDPSGGADEGFRRRFARAMKAARVVFQPVVWADGSDVFGYEALVRSNDTWLTGPLELFTAAEEAGAVVIFERVIRTRVAEAVHALDDGRPVFVNVHPAALEDPDLTDPGAPLTAFADRVIIELTQGAALSALVHLGDKLAELRGLGFRIALDDLSGGYHSLRSLAEVNPDVAKFDMGLVRDIDSRPLHAELLASMIGICRDLGIRTAGVGVETDAECTRLSALGCELLQGFRFARPRWPPADIAW